MNGAIKTICSLAVLLLVTGATQSSLPVPGDSPRADEPASTQSVRFTTVDVRLDPKSQPLAAYQLEFIAPQAVKLVGIEGGDAGAFKDPPYYDPAALSRSRVILAAFSTAKDLPKVEFRVARLHVQIDNSQQTPEWKVKLIVASGADGTTIPAAIATLAEGAQK